jgi:D-alanyl-D-alanine carboxypeptidase (penicillin-binding protein 5/6)
MIAMSWRVMSAIGFLWCALALAAFPAATEAARAPRARRAPSARAGPVAAVLMDVGTGRTLYGRELHRRMEPASTTKILTALLAIERLPLDARVVIGERAGQMRHGSVIGVEAGEQWTVDDLLHALLLRSANDAAAALAERVAGSVEGFADLMNSTARSIGARHSQFVNPYGLHDPAHYTTAYDLALIARHALRHPTFASIVRVQSWTLERPNRPPQEIANTNKLLGRYQGADGVKTGLTAAAGRVLVASATRNGWRLLAVVLKSPDTYQDAERLLDYGFGTFQQVRVAQQGQEIAATRVGGHARLVAVVPADVQAAVRRGAALSKRVTLRPDLRPPVAAGVHVGEVRFFEGETLVARSVLVAAGRVVR